MSKPRIIWIGCMPCGASNIGDQAQTLATEKYLNEMYPDHEIIQFYRGEELTTKKFRKMMYNYSKEDVVLIHSSGDWGSRYPSWHLKRRQIVDMFKDNKVIQLPTTVYYEDNEKGKMILEQDKEFYKGYDNLTLMCREQESLKIAQQLPIKSIYFPDFVFSLKPTIATNPTKKVLLNLRTDGESALTCKDRKELQDKYETEAVDLHKLPYKITENIREQYVMDLCATYQKYELVVTDMMHSMVFAIINKVPFVTVPDAIPHKMVGYITLPDFNSYFKRDIINE